jgi:hypothetical protein
MKNNSEKHFDSIKETDAECSLIHSSRYINLEGAQPVKGKINFKKMHIVPVILDAKIISLV